MAVVIQRGGYMTKRSRGSMTANREGTRGRRLALIFEVLSPQARAGYSREWKALPLATLRELRKDLNHTIEEREGTDRSDTDIAAEVQDPKLVESFGKEEVPRGKGRWLQQVKLNCCDACCQRCPHGPYWFLFRFVKSRGVIVARAVPGPAFSPELIARLREGARPGVPYLLMPERAMSSRGEDFTEKQPKEAARKKDRA